MGVRVMTMPRIISADDHVIEPAHVWHENLPPEHRHSGPRLVRRRGRLERSHRGSAFVDDDSAEWADCWMLEDRVIPVLRSLGSVSFLPDAPRPGAATYDEFRPGCYDRAARLVDMDANHTEASLCFPTFPRFCGQTFLEVHDRALGLACVRAYNDWMIGDWCGGAARGRLIPLTLVPLWDATLAAEEVRRCADMGSHAICFSELPTALGLPSLYTEHWEPLWAACDETSTVVNLHIGSSSMVVTTSADAPASVPINLRHVGAERALVDWLTSGILERHRGVKLVLSEGQAGWMPFTLERMDRTQRARAGKSPSAITQPFSSYVPGRVYACLFDELTGLAMRDRIGMTQLLFETDYPHGDSTWPRSAEVAAEMVAAAGLDDDETRQLLRGNAIACFGLERYGLAA
jgi:predicted TIM-barrel fold metal-dependent hydrolase